MNTFLLRVFIIVFVFFNAVVIASELEETAASALNGNSEAVNSLIYQSKAGNAEAQMWLGTYYYARKEYIKALSLFKKSSLKLNLQAIFNLARMYDKGLGVKKNTVKARKLYLFSAEKGYADSQHNVGTMYLLGEGGEKNSQEALKWFALAAEQGQRMAQRDLGIMFAEGNGVKRDLALAYAYMSFAAINNEPSAGVAAEKIKNLMTIDEINQANAYINEAKSKRGK